MQESAMTNTHEAAIEPFVISRIFDAPRELVFKAFTEPDRLKHWWGPKGFRVIVQSMDMRPGGMYHYGLQASDGNALWGRFVFREVAAPERIVFVNSFSDVNGGLTRHPLNPSWPLEMLSMFHFADVGGGRAQVTVTWVPINDTDVERQAFDNGRESMTQGWTGTLDQLDAYLGSVR
jgi:uncharacterized protein YndB with AHSA1/START domain